MQRFVTRSMTKFASPRIPVATYRLQLNKDFTFYDASQLSGYLRLLGISDVYTSPLLQAKSGSMHCYDVTDHSKLNSEIGGTSGFEKFSSRLRRSNIGILVDIVANHMSTDQQNVLWKNLLEYGIHSEYASFFDIYWSDRVSGSETKIRLPVLGDLYAKVLKSKELKLVFDDKDLRLKLQLYGSLNLPLSAESHLQLLKEAKTLAKQGRIRQRDLEVLHRVMESLETLTKAKPQNGRLKHLFRSKMESLIEDIEKLWQNSAEFKSALQRTIHDFNQTNNTRVRYRKMRRFLDLQHYEISYWRDPKATPNYRRFFYINDLVAIRVEDPLVFCVSHKLLFDLIFQGKITGLRVDHIDGLREPAEYLRRLQREFSQITNARRISNPNPLYVIVEKILAENETLPHLWSTYGTTGYDFARDVGAVFVELESEEEVLTTYQRFTGKTKDFKQISYDCKKKIIKRYMGLELERLSTKLWQISKEKRGFQSLALRSIRETLEEIIAHFSVYRTYITPRSSAVSSQDFNYIQNAISQAISGNVKINRLAASLFQKVMSSGFAVSEKSGAITEFVMRFQQVTAPIVAKGIEDTALYRYNPLVSLNEVGGNPARFGITVEEFHSRNHTRLRSFPHTMLTTSTHDTKRSEDVRSRISVLSEIPHEWSSVVNKWGAMNRSRKFLVGGREAPDKNDEYLFYQTLIGTWPLKKFVRGQYSTYVERIVSYMKKATKEAKLNTSWIDPNPLYDQAVEKYVTSVLINEENSGFLNSVQNFSEKVSYFGMLNSLSQLLLKLTCPGVPDIFQGNEIWDFSLVDPDNRRKVDFKLRKRILNFIYLSIRKKGKANLSTSLLSNWRNGAIKMFVTSVALNYRNRYFDIFQSGNYIPLIVKGKRKENVCSFMRENERGRCIVIAPRLFTRLTNVDSPPIGKRAWGDTSVEVPSSVKGKLMNLFTGEPVMIREMNGISAINVSEALTRFPLALLV